MTTLRMNKVIRSDGRIPIKKGLWCPLRKMYFPKSLLQNSSNAANFPCVRGAERPALRPARA